MRFSLTLAWRNILSKSPSDFLDAADYLVKTNLGKQATGIAGVAAVGAAKVIGGTAAAGMIAAVAPVLIPIAATAGLAVLASKLSKKD